MSTRFESPKGPNVSLEVLEPRLLLNGSAEVAGMVWYDANADGLRDAGEAGMADMVVDLYRMTQGGPLGVTQTRIASAISAADGTYSFSGLEAGDYQVQFRAPVDAGFAPLDQGGDESLDSDAHPLTGLTATIALDEDQALDHVDAGIVGDLQGDSWGFATGAEGEAEVTSVVTDEAGFVYLGGNFRGTVDFDPTVGVSQLSSSGSFDGFIVKLTEAGDLVWACAVGSGASEQLRGLAVDNAGNVAATGRYFGTVDFDPGAGVSELTSAGNADIFVMQLDADGNFNWARSVGGEEYDDAWGIAADSQGAVIVTGAYRGTADFDPGAGENSRTSAGGDDIFVLKLTGAGAYAWAETVGGTSYDTAYAVAVDSADNIVVTGRFRGTVDFNPDAEGHELAAGGGEDAFVWKLASDGTTSWEGAMGGSSYDRALDVSVDGDGAIYVTGYYRSTADFDPSESLMELTSSGSSDTFVAKMGSAGNLEWARSVGGSSLDRGVGVTTDSNGYVYVTGLFSGTADFYPGAGTYNLQSNGLEDIFVLRLQSDGEFFWGVSYGGEATDMPAGVALDSSEMLWTAGSFLGQVDFDPDVDPEETYFMTADSTSGFAQKLDRGGLFFEQALFLSGNHARAERAVATVVDDDGNIYVTGLFSGTEDFDAGPGRWFLSSTSGSLDVYVARYTSAGVLAWARSIGGEGDDTVSDLVVDGDGNVVLTGAFSGAIDADPGEDTVELTSAGGEDAFLVSLDSGGDFNWATSFGGAEDDAGHGLVVDDAGVIFTTGAFGGAVDFDPSGAVVEKTAAGSTDVYLASFSPGGVLNWVEAFGGSAADAGLDVTLGDGGRIYVGGQFAGTADFDPSAATDEFASAGSDDGFVAAFTPAGVYEWAAPVGGASPDAVRTLEAAVGGGVYAAGAFSGSGDFDPGNGTRTLYSQGGADAFVLRMDDAGGLVWARAVGGSGDETVTGLAVDASGDLYVSGVFAETMDADPTPGEHLLTSAGGDDVFVLHLGSAGQFLWADALGGPGSETGGGLAVDGDNHVILTGTFRGAMDATPVGDTTILTAGSVSLFTTRFTLDDLPSLTGLAYNDLNGNGERDDGETGLAGRTIYLDANNNGRYDAGEATAVTGSDGRYTFYNLDPGSYTVSMVDEAGWEGSWGDGAASAPSFGESLTDVYWTEQTFGGGLTFGVDVTDSDGDPLSIDVSVTDPGLWWTVPEGNRNAVMHIVDENGDPIFGDGDILLELFEGRSPLATERFITLSQNGVTENGELVPDGAPFYTDVPIHRVIDDFMFQSGDAENGDGTGGSPLGDFDDQFDPTLSFAWRGALAMANSGADTNDSQFFVTDAPTYWLNYQHTIFGQVINGWDVYEAVMTVPTEGPQDSTPVDPIYVQSIDIVEDAQRGTVTLVASPSFAGSESTVTVGVDDGHGNVLLEDIAVGTGGEVDTPTAGTNTRWLTGARRVTVEAGAAAEADFGSTALGALGDFNNDGAFNGLDIPGMKQALGDSAAWEAETGLNVVAVGDFNNDGAFNGLDIPGFKAGLAGGAVATSAPVEPTDDGTAAASPSTVDRVAAVAGESSTAGLALSETMAAELALASWRDAMRSTDRDDADQSDIVDAMVELPPIEIDEATISTI